MASKQQSCGLSPQRILDPLGRHVAMTYVSAALFGACLLFSSCTARTETTSAEPAWTARSEVEIREELGPRAPVIANLPLGTEVDIIGRRRKLVRVRVGENLEGWAHSDELISEEVKKRLEILTDRTHVLPSQGRLQAFAELNVHLEPYRWSPTIYQLRADEAVDLLFRKRVVRREQGTVAMPPEAPREDWYLVRLPTGAAGWLLGSRTYAAIPIEVAQYAEGRRILAYFGLGPVTDQTTGEPKETWLWVQSPRDRKDADFDRLRVFRWSNHRNAYQTIKLERGIEGYLPITMLNSVKVKKGEGPGFRMVVNRDGVRLARTYALVGQRVYLASEEPAPPPIQIEERVALPVPGPPKPPSLSERLFSWLPSLL